MPVITIAGPLGCGAIPIGQLVAQKLNLSFVDRLALTQASKLLEMPVGALVAKEQQVNRFKDRLGRFIETMLERSAISGEMYAGGALMTLPPDAYSSLGTALTLKSPKLGDKEFIEAIATVINKLYDKGNVVIIGRAANMILADRSNVFHVGLFAPTETRVQILMRQEHWDRAEAETFVQEYEAAHVKYYKKFYNVHPREPRLYDIFLNMGQLQPETAADMIAHVANDVVSARQQGGQPRSHVESFSTWETTAKK